MSYLTSVNFSYTFQNGIRGRLFKNSNPTCVCITPFCLAL
uniref:Uncharacterized protein n=1 Tax=Anguilla anguilla TaxID=7936 RepID=A0A0E9PPB5_ANGAN